jgi:quaternary ammonium compound-resistance protein SugE
MAWVVLFIAGFLEVAWSLGLKYTEGFTKLLPSLLTGAALVASTLLLAQAARTLPIGTAYPIWVGIGVVGAALGGTILFHEPMPPARIAFIALAVRSIVGLKVTTPP